MSEVTEVDQSQRPLPEKSLIESLLDTARKQVDLEAKERPDSYWYVVSQLHGLGCPELLDACIQLMKSACREDRVVGYDVAAQAFNGTQFLKKCIRLKDSDCQEDQAAYQVANQAFEKLCPLAEMAMRSMIEANEDENDVTVLTSLLHGLGHIREPAAIPFMLRFAHNAHADVRYAVARGLPMHGEGSETSAAISALIKLSGDVDKDVRDWATFGLGSQSEADTPGIRDALKARLEDEDIDSACEALVGLARRRDPIALPAIKKRLEEAVVFELAIKAAELYPDPSLLPLLEDLRETMDWSEDNPADNSYRRGLEAAIEACRGVVSPAE